MLSFVSLQDAIRLLLSQKYATFRDDPMYDYHYEGNVLLNWNLVWYNKYNANVIIMYNKYNANVIIMYNKYNANFNNAHNSGIK